MKARCEYLAVLLLAATAAAQDPVAVPKPGANGEGPAGEVVRPVAKGANEDGLLLLDTTAACRIQLDGNAPEDIPVGVKAIPLSSGPHALVATAESGSIVNERFDIPSGGQQALVLQFAQVPGPQTSFYRGSKDGLEYALIPAGDFSMGCTPGDVDCDTDENPTHRVAITKEFYLGRTEATEESFERFCSESSAACAGVRRMGDEGVPKTGVSWTEADAFAAGPVAGSRPRPNGSGRRAVALSSAFRWQTRSTMKAPTTAEPTAVINGMALRPLRGSRPTLSVCTIWRVIFGNGARTGTRRITTKARRTRIRRGRRWAPSASFGVVRGTVRFSD